MASHRKEHRNSGIDDEQVLRREGRFLRAFRTLRSKGIVRLPVRSDMCLQ
jgi:hypothetical protein